MNNNIDIISIKVNTKQLDEAIEKANKLKKIINEIENKSCVLNKSSISIDFDDFETIKILISERFFSLNIEKNKGIPINENAYEIIKKLYDKYMAGTTNYVAVDNDK